jgi:regulator of protease activity HflC (stomatin/prohibitin superfamily)
MRSGSVGAFAAGLAVLVALTIIIGSWYTVDQTQRGVLLRNGALVAIVQPGLHFKWPLIESIYKIDMQTHNISITAVGGVPNLAVRVQILTPLPFFERSRIGLTKC